MSNKPKYSSILTKEFLVEHYIDKKLSTTNIAKLTGISDMTISVYLRKNGIELRPVGLIPQDYVGCKFGKLKCLKSLGRISAISRTYMYECICDCGKIKPINIEAMKLGVTLSCGCLRRISGNKSKTWRGTTNISAKLWLSIIHGAKIRGKELEITIELLESLILKQNFKCAISGLDITNDKSLDRIDNSLGYVENNVQWVHKDVNRMKWTHSEEYFVKLCKIIAKNNE